MITLEKRPVSTASESEIIGTVGDSVPAKASARFLKGNLRNFIDGKMKRLAVHFFDGENVANVAASPAVSSNVVKMLKAGASQQDALAWIMTLDLRKTTALNGEEALIISLPQGEGFEAFAVKDLKKVKVDEKWNPETNFVF